MKTVEKLLLVGVMIGAANAASARVRVAALPSRDSEMMIIQQIVEEDPQPYQEVYESKLRALKNSLQLLDTNVQVAEFYTTPPQLERPQTGSGTLGYLKSVFSANKEKERVETPEQEGFIRIIVERMKKANDLKGAKDVEKKLAKKKLSSKAMPYIKEYLVESATKRQHCRDTAAKLQKLKEEKGVIECVRASFPNQEVESRKIEVVDTILNSAWRPGLFMSRQLKLKNGEGIYSPDDEAIIAGWEWLSTESAESKSQNYPVSVEYYLYSSHPEFKVVKNTAWYKPEYVVYDSEGQLVSIPKYDETKLSMRLESLQKAMRAYAYQNNEMDIRKAGAHTQHYVKVQSGLEKLTAKEKQASERASTAIANAMLGSMNASMKYGSNSRKGKAAQRKSAAQLMGVLASGSDFYDESGAGWLEDIDTKYDEIFPLPYKLERTGDTSFRLTYVDSEGKGKFEILTEFKSGAKPFSYKTNYTVNSISGQSFFTSEELAKYQQLMQSQQN